MERAREAIAMLLTRSDDPRLVLKTVLEDFHKTFHRFFKRLRSFLRGE